jgi:multidrug resistance efflux pump
MKIRKYFVSIQFLSLVFLSHFTLGCGGNKSETEITFKPVLEDFSLRVSSRGEIRSLSEITVVCPEKIEGVIASLARPGSHVTKGDVVVRIVADSMEKDLKTAERKLRYNHRKLRKIRKEIEQERLRLDLEVLEREVALKVNEIELEKSLGEKDSRVIQGLDLNLKLLEERYNHLRERHTTLEILSQSNSVADSEFQRLKKDLAIASLNRQLGVLEKKDQVQGLTGKARDKLYLVRNMLRREWERSLQSRAEKLKSLPLKIEKRELIIQKRTREVEKIRSRLGRTIIRARKTGVFLQAKHPWNGSLIDVGTEARSRMQLGKIIDFDSLQARLKVEEKYIDLIQPRQVVELRPLGRPGRKIQGRILSIQAMATPYNPSNPRSRRYHGVEVELIGSPTLIPGETIKGSILVRQFSQVYKIPKELARADGKSIWLRTRPHEIQISSFEQVEGFYLLPSSVGDFRLAYVLD